MSFQHAKQKRYIGKQAHGTLFRATSSENRDKDDTKCYGSIDMAFFPLAISSVRTKKKEKLNFKKLICFIWLLQVFIPLCRNCTNVYFLHLVTSFFSGYLSPLRAHCFCIRPTTLKLTISFVLFLCYVWLRNVHVQTTNRKSYINCMRAYI